MAEIAHEAKAGGYKKVFLCTGADLVTFGVTEKVTKVLDDAGLAYEVFTDFKPNPTIENVQGGVTAYKASGADYIIALGGGSAIDTAKAIGIVANNPDFADIRSLEGNAATNAKAVFSIAMPTTAGTAAEVTINYVITDVQNRRKFVCVDVHDIPEVAIIDADLMDSMPKSLAAATGMDALTHSIEGYITKAAWTMTDMFHLKAMELISQSLRDSVSGDKKGRDVMSLAQYIAGMGFSNAGLGLVHSMAHTLGAMYDTPHGLACAVNLPNVMAFNADCTDKRYRDIAKAMGVKGVKKMSQKEYRKAAINAVRKLGADVGIPAKLQGTIKKKDLDFLCESALADACYPGNPKAASKGDVRALFEQIM